MAHLIRNRYPDKKVQEMHRKRLISKSHRFRVDRTNVTRFALSNLNSGRRRRRKKRETALPVDTNRTPFQGEKRGLWWKNEEALRGAWIRDQIYTKRFRRELFYTKLLLRARVAGPSAHFVQLNQTFPLCEINCFREVLSWLKLSEAFRKRCVSHLIKLETEVFVSLTAQHFIDRGL